MDAREGKQGTAQWIDVHQRPAVPTVGPTVPVTGAGRRVLEFADLGAYEWLNIPAWVYDGEQFRHWWANPAGLRFWRADSLQELCSRSYADTSTATLSRIALSMQAHARGETTYERWTLYPRGAPASILLQGTGIRLPDGRVGILFMAELGMQMEPTLVRGVEALNHASVLVGVHRLQDGQVLMRNPAAEMALGHGDASNPVNAFAHLFEDPAIGAALLEKVRTGEHVQTRALLRTRPTANWHMVGARKALDPATGEDVILFYASDVTELMKTQQALELEREHAEAGNRAKSAFLASITHELRTPLNGIQGTLHLLARSALDARQRRWVKLALDSGVALGALMEDLIELAAIEGSDRMPEHELLELRAVVSSAARLLEAEAVRKGLALALQVADDVPECVVGDARWLRRIVFNLVGNAVKFTASGSVDVKVSRCDLEGERHCMRIDVTDTGPGIAEDQREMIFRPFVQLDQSSTRAHGGVGMGLTLVRRMVDRLGGFLELRSTPGQGSRFSVVLPIA